jgi:hypothetical protein
MRACAELADLAMRLARAAAAKTLEDWATPEQPVTAEPPAKQTAAPTPTPKSDLAAPRPAGPAAAATFGRAASRKTMAPAMLFIQLVAIVRACIQLEAALAATLPAAPATVGKPHVQNPVDPDAAARASRYRALAPAMVRPIPIPRATAPP